MERREALKNIGLSFGFLVATPTALSILQSCQTEEPWLPTFFSEEEGSLLRKTLDMLLPATETLPGALDANVHKFVDQYIAEVVELEEQQMAKQFFGAFGAKLLTDSGKELLSKLKTEDIEPLLSTTLKKTKEEEEALYESMAPYMEALEKGEEASLPDETAIFVALSSIRGLAVWGYRQSELVGENILHYRPIPGQQKGCIDLVETTGGVARSPER